MAGFVGGASALRQGGPEEKEGGWMRQRVVVERKVGNWMLTRGRGLPKAGAFAR